MSVAELFYGSARSSNPVKNNSLIEEFLLTVDIIQPDLDISKKFGELRSMLRGQGDLVPDADIFIAAVTYEKANLLVTGNIRHFERFPNLNIENWIL
jgi:tRNA(fMet)-specific endonuclease VapC